MKKLVSLMVVVVMLLSLVACAPQTGTTGLPSGETSAANTTSESTAESGPVAGGTLTIGLSSEVANVAAWRLRSPQEKLEWSCTYEPLAVLDDNGKVVPFLAKSIDSDPANLSYTITLRDDVNFSDGSPLDADALLWNFENFKENSQTSSTHFGDVESFEKTGDYSVVIHLANWNSQIPYSLTSTAGLMYSKNAFDANGMDWCMENAVGTGPFVIGDWVNGEKKIFTKNTNYWNKDSEPMLDSIEFRVIKDEMSAQAALTSGEIDGYYGPTATMQTAMTDQGFGAFNNKMSFRIRFLVFASAVEGSPLADLRVRQAISYAIDSESIAKNIDKGLSIPSNQYAVEGSPFYNDQVKGYGYDPEKAKALLAEAGYEKGFVTTIYTGTDQPNTPYMIAIQGYLSAVGIKLNLVFQDVSIWSSKTMYEIEEGMDLIGHGFGINLVNQMASNFSKRAVEGVGMLKNSALHPDDLDEVIMAALRAKDYDTMIENAKIAEELIIDKYCLAYPVVIGYVATTLLSGDIVDNTTYATNNEYLDYTNIYRIK